MTSSTTSPVQRLDSDKKVERGVPSAPIGKMAKGKALLRSLANLKVFTHLILVVLGFFYLFPFLWMLGSSLKSINGFFNDGLSLVPDKWLWQNYTDAWTVGRFGTYFGNTVFITVFVVVFTNLFSSMSGFVLARTKIPGRKIIVGVILVTLFLPRGYTIIPTFEVVLKLGLNNTLWSIILVSTAGGLVFNTFLYMGYFTTLHREIEEAAVVDGASFPRLYWNIMLPLAGPMIATVTLFTFISTWNDFFTPLVFTLGNPELRTLAVGMFAFVGEHSRDWTLLCAGAVITILPIVITFVFLQRYFIEGISGAVK
jgi:ABC-type glycerol-3-phosphate transport system permease component